MTCSGVVSFAAVLRDVTQCSPGGALRDIPKDGCEGDYSGADPGFFSGEGAPLRNDFNPVSCFFFFSQNATYLRKLQVSGVVRTPCSPPLDPVPAAFRIVDIFACRMYSDNVFSLRKKM